MCNRARTAAVRAAVALLAVAALALTGCGHTGWGRPGQPLDGVGSSPSAGRGGPSGPSGPSSGPPSGPSDAVPPAAVQGGAGTSSDRLAATVVAGVERYWRERFPVEFGRRWVNIHGFHAVDPKDAATPVPCVRRALDLAEQAAYCPRLDTVAWDRTGLLPRLRAEYGDGAVLVALAHEIGHAVQDRLDIDVGYQVREPERFPTILLEGMADCFAGVVVRAAVDGGLAGVRLAPSELDRSLSALLSFRDPVGMTAGGNAHGDAFDRASAFLDGYGDGDGARRCATMSVRTQTFTQRGFSSASDAATGGTLPVGELLEAMVPDARAWFGRLVTDRGRPWRAPDLALGAAGCVAGGAQGPVRYCAEDGTLSASVEQLAAVHYARGDYAGGELVASRYALAAVGALGRPVRGAEAGRTAVCLTGAYTRALFDRGVGTGFGLSPGDIDEAVDELISQDLAARDATGLAPEGDLGFRRIEQFRAGALGGPAGCGV